MARKATFTVEVEKDEFQFVGDPNLTINVKQGRSKAWQLQFENISAEDVSFTFRTVYDDSLDLSVTLDDNVYERVALAGEVHTLNGQVHAGPNVPATDSPDSVPPNYTVVVRLE